MESRINNEVDIRMHTSSVWLPDVKTVLNWLVIANFDVRGSNGLIFQALNTLCAISKAGLHLNLPCSNLLARIREKAEEESSSIDHKRAGTMAEPMHTPVYVRLSTNEKCVNLGKDGIVDLVVVCWNIVEVLQKIFYAIIGRHIRQLESCKVRGKPR